MIIKLTPLQQIMLGVICDNQVGQPKDLRVFGDIVDKLLTPEIQPRYKLLSDGRIIWDDSVENDPNTASFDLANEEIRKAHEAATNWAAYKTRDRRWFVPMCNLLEDALKEIEKKV